MTEIPWIKGQNWISPSRTEQTDHGWLLCFRKRIKVLQSQVVVENQFLNSYHLNREALFEMLGKCRMVRDDELHNIQLWQIRAGVGRAPHGPSSRARQIWLAETSNFCNSATLWHLGNPKQLQNTHKLKSKMSKVNHSSCIYLVTSTRIVFIF